MANAQPTIVLVHGAWADGSSWGKVIALLQNRGLPVVAVQIPLTSVADDAAAVSRMVADLKGDVVLVGHSWGGVAVTQAGVDPKVRALVFLSAFAPDVGETGSGLIGAHPAPPALSTVVTDSAGFVYQTEAGMADNIAPDMAPAETRVLAAVQGRLAGAAFGQTVTAAAWKAKPCWYVMTPQDRVVSAALQQAFAMRMRARTSVMQGSHMSLITHAEEVADVIVEAAAAARAD